MNDDLNGKTAVITGGAGVLCGAIASHLASVGVKVAILGRTKATVFQKVTAINAAGGVALALLADVLDQTQLEAARDKVLEHWGRIDILINGAGGNIREAVVMPEDSFFEMPMEAFDRVFRLNLHGVVLCSQVFGKDMAERKEGVILNISSMAAQLPLTRVVGYSAAKAALDNFTRWMAVEMAHKFGEGVRVNAIAPGFFISEQNKRLLLNEDGSLTSRGKTIITQTPMGRFGYPEELNGAAEWLCSGSSRFVTGVVVPVDGGYSAFSGV